MAKKASIPAAIRNAVMSRFTCCAACGTWDADECGHIVAESAGGAMVLDNFVRLCGSCNRKQANRSVVFAAFASYTESPALIQSRRAYWAKYLGSVKIAKPYKPS
jgi:hypothetical protein